VFAVTVSAGFASVDEKVNINKLLDNADKRLDIAKRTKKNRVVYEVIYTLKFRMQVPKFQGRLHKNSRLSEIRDRCIDICFK
jgi:hypothetical protein